MKKLFLVFMFILAAGVCFANSVSLMNDSPYTLKATIYDANGELLGEFTLNPRDASVWSDDYQNFGTESGDASQIPYSVNWTCMNGGSYGTCQNVAAGSVVTAQSCGGAQECPQQQQQLESPY
jgi:hypothetical protein